VGAGLPNRFISVRCKVAFGTEKWGGGDVMDLPGVGVDVFDNHFFIP
jgi:hypothetical protein